MTVIRFPKRRHSGSAELRASRLAEPCRHLEAKVIIDGPLAETIAIGAGRAQLTPDAFIVQSLHALFGGGQAA